MSYTLTLNGDEHRSLAWLADRYEYARVLFDGMKLADDDACRADDPDAWIGTLPFIPAVNRNASDAATRNADGNASNDHK